MFESPLDAAIHHLKYRGAHALAFPLAQFMVQGWPRWRVPVDLVAPIPLHRDRQRTRGYNQADLLARRFSQLVRLPYAPEALNRVRQTQAQVGLSATERQHNVAGAFTADRTIVCDRAVLLVDDVYTTGATLAAAATALLEAGAGSVSGYCLARAR